MIDPFTAFAAVQSAVALIKKASETVDDVASLGPMIGKYFEAKHQATKAVNQAKADGNNLGKAIEIELALKAQQDFEKQLSDLFFSTNNMDVWQSIKKRAAEMDREAIDLKRKAEARQRLREQEQAELLQWILFGLLAFVVVCIGVYGTILFVDVCEAKKMC